MIGDDPVVLLGHRAVVAAQPGLDVHERDVARVRRQRAGDGRVRVALDDDHVGRRRSANARSSSVVASPSCVPRDAPPTSSCSVGRLEPELGEQRVRQRRVVVLTGVNGASGAAERPEDGRELSLSTWRSGANLPRALPAQPSLGGRDCAPVR